MVRVRVEHQGARMLLINMVRAHMQGQDTPMLFINMPSSQSPEAVLKIAAILGDHELGRFVTVLLPTSFDLGTVTAALNAVRHCCPWHIFPQLRGVLRRACVATRGCDVQRCCRRTILRLSKPCKPSNTHLRTR